MIELFLPQPSTLNVGAAVVMDAVTALMIPNTQKGTEPLNPTPMLDQILKERTPDQKPRFFLHDEMKAWLGDHLKLSVQLYPNKTGNWALLDILQRKHGIYHQPTVGIALEIKWSIDNETMHVSGTNLPMLENETILIHLLNENEKIKQRLEILEHEKQDLKRRLDLVENPLPL